MTDLIINNGLELTGKFKSGQRFLRVTTDVRDAYFSRGATFAFNWFDATGGQNLSYRYRNGPVIVTGFESVPSGWFAPTIPDTSVGVTF